MSSSQQQKRVVLYGDGRRVDVMHAIEQVVPLLRERADVIHVCTDRVLDLSRVEADLLINFGGDGSILGSVRSMQHNQIPIVGVNFGKVGFLTAFELPDLLVSLDAILGDDLPRQQSTILDATLIRKSGETRKFLAVNDAVVSRSAKSRLVSLRLSIDDHYVATYKVDGIIIATPAGSTAHSLSSGGPVVEPEMDAMLISPICPHTLAVRPMLVPGSRKIEIEVVESESDMGVTFDGQVFREADSGDRLVITTYSSRFILLGGGLKTFYHNLRQKLLWGGHVEHLHTSAWRPHSPRLP